METSKKCAVAIDNAMTIHNKGWIEISFKSEIALFKADHLDRIDKIIALFNGKIIFAFVLIFVR